VPRGERGVRLATIDRRLFRPVAKGPLREGKWMASLKMSEIPRDLIRSFPCIAPADSYPAGSSAEWQVALQKYLGLDDLHDVG